MEASTVTATTPTKTLQIDNFIAGEYVKGRSGKTFETINPATGQPHGVVALGTKDDINDAVAAATEAFEKGPWPRMTMQERAAIVKRIGDLILERKDELARAESLDTGKPISESSNGDIPRAALNFHFFAQFAASYTEECFTPAPAEMHVAVREPLGVCGLITPWNLPLYLATWKIAPCLVMGNTCVLKPAEWTPYTAYLLADIITQAGVPKGVFNIVNGFGADGAGEALTVHPGVRSISFTGETSTGRAIMVNAAATLKKLSFELGGKGANVIFDDANLDEAIETSVRAAYRNQGQICLAGSRLFVHKDVYGKVVERLVEKVQKINVGDPLDPKTEMGALISKEHMEKVLGYIEHGKKEGKLRTGGERLTKLGDGYFLAPTVFEGLDIESKLLKEEIFGPVLPVVPFDSEEQAVEFANSTPYGLSCSIWSENVNRCHRVSQQIRTGLVWVNCWFARDLRTPFGGQKSSGIGREGGRYSLEFFSEAKTISYKYSK